MGKEDFRNSFRKHLATSNQEKARVESQVSTELAEKEIENERLISEFDNHVNADLQKAEEAFLRREPVASILGIFDEATLTVAQIESVQGFSSQIDFFIEPLGRVSKEKPMDSKEKIKFTRFLNREVAETFDGIAKFIGNKSIVDLIDGVEMWFKPKSVSLGISIHDSNLHLWFGNTHNQLALSDINPEDFSKLLANIVSSREYILPPATDYNWGGPYS